MTHLSEIKLSGFAGAEGAWPLGPVTGFISEDNGVGKSTILRTIALALTGKVDGVLPKDSLPLSELANRDGQWRISLFDNEGARTARQWTGGTQRVRSYWIDGLAEQNAIHEKAIAERYQGVEVMNIEALLAMIPPELYRYVMGLCAGAGKTTRTSVLASLATTHPDAGGLFPTLFSLEGLPEDNEPLAALDRLTIRLGEAMTETRRDVRRINDIGRKVPKEPPPGPGLEELMAELAELEKASKENHQEVGALQQKIKDRDKDQKKHGTKVNKLTSLRTSMEKAKVDIAYAENAAGKPTRIINGAKGTTKSAITTAKRESKNMAKAIDILEEEIRDDQSKIDNEEVLVERLSCGECPFCGQATDKVIKTMKTAIPTLKANLDGKKKEVEELVKMMGPLRTILLNSEKAIKAKADKKVADDQAAAHRKTLAVIESQIADIEAELNETPATFTDEDTQLAELLGKANSLAKKIK